MQCYDAVPTIYENYYLKISPCTCFSYDEIDTRWRELTLIGMHSSEWADSRIVLTVLIALQWSKTFERFYNWIIMVGTIYNIFYLLLLIILLHLKKQIFEFGFFN